MPRKRIEDIISSRPKNTPIFDVRRAIQHSRPQTARPPTARVSSSKAKDAFFPVVKEKISSFKNIFGFQSLFRHPLLWSATAVGLIVLVFLLLWIFEKATVKIFPAERTMDVDASFVAFRGDTAPISGSGTATPVLSFEIMETEAQETKTVKATEVEHVDRAASGAIIIYNDYSKANQRLITNTRFETPQGLTYRIHESVVVPGQKVIQGKVVPGSVEVLVYADEPGEKYNIGLSDFTIPGFKGLPRYKGFYARSKTLMAGGFSGIVKTVPKSEMEKIKKELEEVVTRKLLEGAGTEKPDGFVLFDDALQISFNVTGDSGQQNVNESTVSIVGTGNLRGVIFNRALLENRIGRFLVPTLLPEERVSVRNIDELLFNFQDTEEPDLSNIQKISFSLRGNAHLVWGFDEEELKNALVGKPKSELTAILAQFPSVTRAEVILRPFWKRSFPETSEDIEVKVIVED